jgi:hypothetical protein
MRPWNMIYRLSYRVVDLLRAALFELSDVDMVTMHWHKWSHIGTPQMKKESPDHSSKLIETFTEQLIDRGILDLVTLVENKHLLSSDR